MSSTILVEEQAMMQPSWKGAKIFPSFMVLAVGCTIWFMQPPAGLSVDAWHLFAVFLSTILALIVKPLPMGAVAMFAVAIVCMTGTLTITQALSSFSSNILWLIVCAFLLARGFIKTGLGSRIAYCFISLLGKSSLGLAYGLTATELVLAPFTPSNTARGAGIVYPIIMSLNNEYDSTVVNRTEGKIGRYLIKLLFQVNVITSAMFMTATAANPLIVSIAAENGITITWTTWAVACLVPGLLNLLCLPLAMYFLDPPEIKQTPEAPAFAREKLKALGPLKRDEIYMLITFGILLTLWVFGAQLGVNAAAAAITGLCLLLFTGVLTWEDVIQEKNAWNTFIWMGVLIMLSSQLTALGMMSWFSAGVQSMLTQVHWVTALLLVTVIYYYSHYFFASMTAHVTALFSALLIVAIASGAPPMLAVLFMAVISSLCAGITHYGTGSAPVYFGSNYLSTKKWWRLGGMISLVNFGIWAVAGSVWWKFLGYW